MDIEKKHTDGRKYEKPEVRNLGKVGEVTLAVNRTANGDDQFSVLAPS